MRSSIAVAFGSVLRSVRRQQSLSQEKLAFAANLDRTYISLLELGRHTPSLDTVLALCDALNIPFSDLARRVEIRLQKSNDARGKAPARPGR